MPFNSIIEQIIIKNYQLLCNYNIEVLFEFIDVKIYSKSYNKL